MTIKKNQEFDENFRDIFLEELKHYKENEWIEGEPFSKNEFLELEEVFLRAFPIYNVQLDESQISIEKGALSLDRDDVPYIKYKVHVLPFEVTLNFVAYHNLNWEYYFKG